jgi:hypothetical protein
MTAPIEVDMSRKSRFDLKDYFSFSIFMAIDANVVLMVLFCLHILPAYDIHHYNEPPYTITEFTLEFYLWSIFAFALLSLISIYAWRYPPMNSHFGIGLFITLIIITVWGLFLLYPYVGSWGGGPAAMHGELLMQRCS